MPKVEDIPQFRPAPASVEALKKEQGQSPYADAEQRGPVAVPLVDEEIPQFPIPPRFPAPEVIVKASHRGVEDRGFTFGRGAEWGTTWQRAEELAGQAIITKILTPKPDAPSA